MEKLFPIPVLRRTMMVFFASMGVPLVWSIGSLIFTITVRPLPSWVSISGSVGMVVLSATATAYIIFRALPLKRRARDRGGMVCIGCAYDLPDEDAGRCPECGRDFTRAENRRLWDVQH